MHLFGTPPYVMPAHPLAVTAEGAPDWGAQRLLTRYYAACGASGVGVAVHTTQFEIHHDHDVLRRVFAEAADVVKQFGPETSLVAGIAGDAEQAATEAAMARDLGYVAALLSPYGLTDRTEAGTLARAKAVAVELPVVGFYMQEAVGGFYLSPKFWDELLQIENLVAIKVAPFDRYRTKDVAEEILRSGRDDVLLLTGNDDAIVADLLLPYRTADKELRFSGGLLGQWAVGTKAAVDLTRRIWDGNGSPVDQDVLATATAMVDINQALFDPEHRFAGSIAGVNELLRQQGLLASSRCLSDTEVLANGQADRIALMRERYPELLDETFISEHLDEWMRDVV